MDSAAPDKFVLKLLESPSSAGTDENSSGRGDIYVAQSSRRGPSGDDFSVLESRPRGRFVAGEAFFNYDALGSLREGLPVVDLCSWQFGGLLVNAVLSGFCVTFLHAVLQPLLVAHSSVYHKGQINSPQYLLQWPGAFSVFFGLFSDCFTIYGLRRKTFMFLGWCIALIMFIAVTIVDFATEASHAANGYLFLTFSLAAAVGIQIAWVTALAMTVELAQREHLYKRGHLQALYVIVYFSAMTLTHLLATQLVVPSDTGGPLHGKIGIGQAAGVLAGASALALPFVFYCILEDRTRQSGKITIRRRVAELWHFLQSKVVYNLLFFLIGAVFLCTASGKTVTQALLYWSGISPSKSGYVLVLKATAKVIAAITWKSFLVNYSWRRLATVSILGSVVCYVILVTMTAFAIVRNEWFFFIWLMLSDVPQGWIEVFVVITPTEIADIGREGATMGLITSFMVLITIASLTLWDSLSDAIGFGVSPAEIAADGSSTRLSIFGAAMVYMGINLLSLLMVYFMPTQKLDAQQLRAFGGYNANARLLVLGAFLVLLVYGLVANVLKIYS